MKNYYYSGINHCTTFYTVIFNSFDIRIYTIQMYRHNESIIVSKGLRIRLAEDAKSERNRSKGLF